MSDLNKFRGSKYAYPSNITSIIESIANDIHNDEYVLFIGLPCHVNLVKKRLSQLKTDKLLTVDIVCGGSTYEDVNTQFVDYLEKKYKSAIVSMNVRYKNPNWTPPFIHVVFKNRKCYCKKFYHTAYGNAFEFIKLGSCYVCRFKGDYHCSDITIGDAWGITQKDIGYNHLGVSVAFVHTVVGDEIMSSLTNFVLYCGNPHFYKENNPRYLYPKKITETSDRFTKNYKEYGLIIGYKKTFSKAKKLLSRIKWLFNKLKDLIK